MNQIILGNNSTPSNFYQLSIKLLPNTKTSNPFVRMELHNRHADVPYDVALSAKKLIETVDDSHNRRPFFIYTLFLALNNNPNKSCFDELASQGLNFPRKDFIHFMIGGLTVAAFKPGQSIEGFKQDLDLIRSKKQKDGFFTPEIMNGLVMNEPMIRCPNTKSYFLSAIKLDYLIKTTAVVGGVERTIYVKGIGSDTGQILAYSDFSDSIFNITVVDGKMELRFLRTFRNHKLQETIHKKEAFLEHQKRLMESK